MAITLSYGYKKPQTGDRGPIVFPLLEDDIQQLNDHDHDGLNSALISSSSVIPVTQNILAGAWVSVGNGLYRQAVTIPGATTYDNTFISFLESVTGHLLYLTVEKISATQYYVYINDNSLSLKARYT